MVDKLCVKRCYCRKYQIKIYFIFFLFSIGAIGQTNYSLQVSQNKLFVTKKYIENGIQLSIPDSFTFYCLGERKVLGIVELEDKSEFNVKQELLFLKFNDLLVKTIESKGGNSGDTSLYYEIDDDSKIKKFRIIYFYYDSFYVTNVIGGDGWSSISDGFHNVVITSKAVTIYNFSIQVKNGELVK